MSSIFGIVISLHRLQVWITCFIVALNVRYLNTTPIHRSNSSNSFHPNPESMRMSRQFVQQTFDYPRVLPGQYPGQILPQYGHLDLLPEQFIPAYGASLSRPAQPDIFRNQSFAYAAGYRSPYNGSLMLQEPYNGLLTRSEPEYISPNYRRPPLPKMPVIRPNLPRLLNGSARYNEESYIERRNSSFTESEDPRNPHLTFKHPGTITNSAGTGPITSLRGASEKDVLVTNRTLAKNIAVKPKPESRAVNKSIAARRAKKPKPALTRTALTPNAKPANPVPKSAVKQQPIKVSTQGKSRVQAKRPASLAKQRKKTPLSAKKPSGAVSQSQPAVPRKISPVNKGRKPFATRPKVKPGQVPKGIKVLPKAAIPAPDKTPPVVVLRQDTAQVIPAVEVTQTSVPFTGNETAVLVQDVTSINESQPASNVNDALTTQSANATGPDVAPVNAIVPQPDSTEPPTSSTDGTNEDKHQSSIAAGEAPTSGSGEISTSEPNSSEPSAADSLTYELEPAPTDVSTTIPQEPSAGSMGFFESVMPLGDIMTTAESSTTAPTETTVETFTLAMLVEPESSTFISTDSISSVIEVTEVTTIAPNSSTTATVTDNENVETSTMVVDDGATDMVAMGADSTTSVESDTSTPILESAATTTSGTFTLPPSESTRSMGSDLFSSSTISTVDHPSDQTTTADLGASEGSAMTTVFDFANEIQSTTGASLTETPTTTGESLTETLASSTAATGPTATASTTAVARMLEQESTASSEASTAAKPAATSADADLTVSNQDSVSVTPSAQSATSSDAVTGPPTPEVATETANTGSADVELTTAVTDTEALSGTVPTGPDSTSPDIEHFLTSSEQPSTVDTTNAAAALSTVLSVDDGSSITTEELISTTVTVLAGSVDSSSTETTVVVGTVQTADAFTARATESSGISTETLTALFTETPMVELTSSQSEALVVSQAGEEAFTTPADSALTKSVPEACTGTTVECEIGSAPGILPTSAAVETASTSVDSATKPAAELSVQTSSQPDLLLNAESSSMPTMPADQISDVNTGTPDNTAATFAVSEATQVTPFEPSTEVEQSTSVPGSTTTADSISTDNTAADSASDITSQDTTETTATSDAPSTPQTPQSGSMETSAQPAQAVVSDSTVIPDLIPDNSTETVSFAIDSTADPGQTSREKPFRLPDADVDVSTSAPSDTPGTEEITTATTTIEIDTSPDTTGSSTDTSSITDGLQDTSTVTEFIASHDEITRIAAHAVADSEFISATSNTEGTEVTSAEPVATSDITATELQTLSETANTPASDGSQEHTSSTIDSTEHSSTIASSEAEPEFVENSSSTPMVPQEWSTTANGESFSDIEREGS